MSTTRARIQALAARGDLRIAAHGYDELAADRILARDALSTLAQAIIVEDYPTFPKGPCVLVLQADSTGKPIHVVWGLPAGKDTPGVLAPHTDRTQPNGAQHSDGGDYSEGVDEARAQR